MKKINVLVYLEPYLEPNVNRHLSFINDLPINSLVNNNSINVVYVTSDVVFEQAQETLQIDYSNDLNKQKEFKILKEKVILLPYKDILKICDNYLLAQKACYCKEFSGLFIKFEKIYKRYLNGFIPDIILSWESPTKHLEYMFPQAKALNMYWNPLLRGTHYILDNCGKIFPQGLINYYYDQINNLNINEIASNNLRENYKQSRLTDNSYYYNLIRSYKKTYKKIVILYLPKIDYFLIRENIFPYKSGEEIINYVFSMLPKDYGVFVTQHEADFYDYTDLLNSYSNYINLKETRGLAQVITPHVDFAIGLLTSLIYYIPFYYNIPVVDISNLDRLPFSPMQRKKIEYFLLKHATVEKNTFFNSSDYMNLILSNVLKQDGFGFYLNKEKLSILFIVGSLYISGGTNIILSHASYLADQGYDVTIYSTHSKLEEILRWHKALEQININYVNSSDFNKVNYKDYDVCIFTHFSTVFYGSKVSAKRYIYFIQSHEAFLGSGIDSYNVYSAQLTYTLNLSYITVANWIDKYHKTHYGTKGIVVLNGLDKSVFPPLEEIKEQISSEKKFIVCIEGGLNRFAKGTDRAIEIARKSNADAIYLITPDNVKEYRGCTKVYSQVPQKDMYKIYKQCDVLLKLSHLEGMYGVPLEAFSQGCTVITNRVEGSDEYIKDNYNGIFVDKSIDAIKWINYLKNHPQELLRLKKNALSTAKEWPDMKESSINFNQAIHELLTVKDNFNPNIVPNIERTANLLNNYMSQMLQAEKKIFNFKRSWFYRLKAFLFKERYKREEFLMRFHAIKTGLDVPFKGK